MAYRIAPYTKEETPVTTQTAAGPTTEERLAKLESMLNNMSNDGGKFSGLL